MDIKEILAVILTLRLTGVTEEYFAEIFSLEDTEIELRNDGFKLMFSNDTYIVLYEFKGAIFSTVSPGDGCRYGALVYNQEKAHELFDSVVDQLLAA